MTRIALVMGAVLVAANAGADELFLTEGQAPGALFGNGMTGEAGTLHLDDAELRALGLAVGRHVEERDYRYLAVRPPSDGGRGAAVGVIFVLDVVGQSLPITFAVGVRDDQKLQDIQLMVYREPYGKEINERRFRAQFRDKGASDPLTVEKDISAISGATISSRSATYAARKGLALAAILRQRSGGRPR